MTGGASVYGGRGWGRVGAKTREMDTTAIRRQQLYDGAKRGSSTSTSLTWSASKAKVDGERDEDRDKEKDKDKDKDIVSDPAGLRARLKHRAPPMATTTTAIQTPSSPSSYDKVFDTARQLAELERLRAQDAAYIRTLEQTRTTLVRDMHTAARERAEVERGAASVREEQRRREEAARMEVERELSKERERAARAEGRVGALEEALRAIREKVVELENTVEWERRCRLEWERSLEALAMGGGSGSESMVA
ncbi:hypothetical protein B0F90DRAFT_1667758 [Multifurca ochricompacta]|uniref:Uncharacterized protein n=1 Tax=Multifurca ochricompacta TaxID=376703 RepID=A0AAD4M5R2_9AGAM|nr:hypothetical protein B0F90DRAFT_1667758 [Multifurca ochricompacta]